MAEIYPARVQGTPSLNVGQMAHLNLDTSGNLLVNVATGGGVGGGGGGGATATIGAAYPTTVDPLAAKDPSGNVAALNVDGSGNLKIGGTINATSAATYNASTQNYADGSSNALQADTHGALLTSTRDAAGAVLGVLANPQRIDPVGTTTQPVSAVSLPLPAGAATAAKQPAIGTAGAAAADVLTVQGASSMTPLAGNLTQINGSAIVTGATGVLKVAMTGSTGASLDGSTGSANPSSVMGVTSFPTISVNGALSVAVQAALTVANVKATAGAVYGITVYNPNAAVMFLQFYNTAGTPTLGTSVVWSIPVAPTSQVTISPGSLGLSQLATGIGIGAATAASGAVAPTTPPSVVIWFK